MLAAISTPLRLWALPYSRRLASMAFSRRNSVFAGLATCGTGCPVSSRLTDS